MPLLRRTCRVFVTIREKRSVKFTQRHNYTATHCRFHYRIIYRIIMYTRSLFKNERKLTKSECSWVAQTCHSPATESCYRKETWTVCKQNTIIQHRHVIRINIKQQATANQRGKSHYCEKQVNYLKNVTADNTELLTVLQFGQQK